jgi:hypothetical protein
MYAKLKTGHRDHKTELTGESPLRRQWSTLHCSVMEEEEKDVFICYSEEPTTGPYPCQLNPFHIPTHYSKHATDCH